MGMECYSGLEENIPGFQVAYNVNNLGFSWDLGLNRNPLSTRKLNIIGHL